MTAATKPAPHPDFRIARNGLFYDIVSVASGQPVVELIDCRADAQAYAEEHQALLDEERAAEAEAIALEQHEARDRLVISVEHFLRGIDEAAEDPLLIAGRKSALVAMLRQAVQPFERRA